jgi:hypothetical protein
MPPKRVLAQAPNEYPVRVIAEQYANAEAELPDMDLTDWLGEAPEVLRVRKGPVWWQAEMWDRDELLQGEPDVGFP